MSSRFDIVSIPSVQEVVTHFMLVLYKMGHYFLDRRYNGTSYKNVISRVHWKIRNILKNTILAFSMNIALKKHLQRVLLQMKMSG